MPSIHSQGFPCLKWWCEGFHKIHHCIPSQWWRKESSFPASFCWIHPCWMCLQRQSMAFDGFRTRWNSSSASQASIISVRHSSSSAPPEAPKISFADEISSNSSHANLASGESAPCFFEIRAFLISGLGFPTGIATFFILMALRSFAAFFANPKEEGPAWDVKLFGSSSFSPHSFHSWETSCSTSYSSNDEPKEIALLRIFSQILNQFQKQWLKQKVSMKIISMTHLLLEDESISSTVYHAKRASGEDAPNFLEASNAFSTSLELSGRTCACKAELMRPLNADGEKAWARGKKIRARNFIMRVFL